MFNHSNLLTVFILGRGIGGYTPHFLERSPPNFKKEGDILYRHRREISKFKWNACFWLKIPKLSQLSVIFLLSYGFERLQKSKSSLMACFVNVNKAKNKC